MQNNSKDHLSANASDDQYIEIEEYVEVISTDDKRIKIIGEELGNDTGRAIFTTISKGITSPNELAKILDLSLPLVNWHINRLVEVGLIRVEELKMSSKNRPVRYYGTAKTVLVIVPPERESEKLQNVQRSKFDIIWSRLNKNITAAVSFISGTLVIYALRGLLTGDVPAGSGIQLADPDAIASVSGGSDITVALVGGAIIGAVVLLTKRLMKKD
jgi:DNA-binding transcriptional ArsR family regulator